MVRLLSPLLALLLLLPLTACGGDDPHAQAIVDTAAAMSNFNDVLASITDKESAEANKDELEAAIEELNTLAHYTQGLDEPTGDEASAQLEEDLEQGLNVHMERTGAELMRIAQNPEIMAVLDESMQKFDNIGR